MAIELWNLWVATITDYDIYNSSPDSNLLIWEVNEELLTTIDYVSNIIRKLSWDKSELLDRENLFLKNKEALQSLLLEPESTSIWNDNTYEALADLYYYSLIRDRDDIINNFNPIFLENHYPLAKRHLLQEYWAEYEVVWKVSRMYKDNLWFNRIFLDTPYWNRQILGTREVFWDYWEVRKIKDWFMVWDTVNIPSFMRNTPELLKFSPRKDLTEHASLYKETVEWIVVWWSHTPTEYWLKNIQVLMDWKSVFSTPWWLSV